MASKTSRTTVLVGTRKGLFVLSADARREKWKVDGKLPHFFGQTVNHAVLNPATGTILVAARAGHLGPTVFRSTDMGKNWKEERLHALCRMVVWIIYSPQRRIAALASLGEGRDRQLVLLRKVIPMVLEIQMP